MPPRPDASNCTPRTLRPPLSARDGTLLVDAAGTPLWGTEPGGITMPAAFAATADALLVRVAPTVGRLFWPPRPAALVACVDPSSSGVEWAPLDGDVTLEVQERAWIVDPRTGAGTLVERRRGPRERSTTPAESESAFAIASSASVDPLRLELGGSSDFDLRFVDDAAAWLHARACGAEDRALLHALAEALDRCKAAARTLALRVTMPSPRLAIVRWRDDGPASEAEQEELAKVIASRRAGAHVVLVGETGTSLPRALERLIEGVAPVALHPAEGGSARERRDASGWPKLWAPIGRGRIIQFRGDEPERMAEVEAAFSTSAGAGALERRADEALAAAAEAAIGRSASDGVRDLVAAVALSAARFRHEVDGGERVVVGGGVPTIGRLVRSRERFELTAAALPAADGRHSLVLERATCRTDAGGLLRLELDDEDLGPWRLGAEVGSDGGGSFQLDRFAVPAELFAGRDRFWITAHYLTVGDHVSLRWRFFVEPEPAGIWLNDLEWTAVPEPEAAGVRVDERARRLGRFVTLSPGSTLEVGVPRGYALFVAEVAHGAPAVGDVARGSATGRNAPAVRIEAAASARDEFRQLARTAVPGALAVTIAGDARLRLTAEGHGAVTLIDPRLLKQ